MKSNQVQHGGDHYRTALQHWDVVAFMGFGWEYYLAAASKYLSRYHKTTKDGDSGVLGVDKAAHYVEKLQDLVDLEMVPTVFRTTQGQRLTIDARPGPYDRCVNIEQLAQEFCDVNGVAHPLARQAMGEMFAARNADDLARIRVLLLALADDLRGIVATPPPPPTVTDTAEANHMLAMQTLGADNDKG